MNEFDRLLDACMFSVDEFDKADPCSSGELSAAAARCHETRQALREYARRLEYRATEAVARSEKAEARLCAVRKAVDMYWSVGGFLAAAVSRILDEK